MADLIERVARAIFIQMGDARPWSNLPDETIHGYVGRKAYRKAARAALKALKARSTSKEPG